MKITGQIAIDARMYKHSGIGTYLRNLIRQYASYDIKDQLLLLTPPGFSDENLRTRTCTSRIYSLGEQITVPFITREAQVLHSPHYNAPFLFPGKLVVTIHDLIHLEYEKQLPTLFHRLYARMMLESVVKRADRIITVSNWVGKEIIRRWPRAKNKINVITNGVIPVVYHDNPGIVLEKYGINKPYILYVGLLKRHKNVKQLVRAFLDAQNVLKGEYLLVIVGKLNSDEDGLCDYIANKDEKHTVRLTDYVTESDLEALYDKASLFAFPSLIEGFGLPPLEAMSHGIPVISSNTTCLPEVLGDAPIYFNPYEKGDIVTSIVKSLQDESWRERAKTRGKAVSAQYRWDICAAKHIEIYKSLL